MELRHLLVAIDDSDAGRHAARFAANLAERQGSKLTVLSVFPTGERGEPARGANPENVQARLGPEIFASHPSLTVELAAVRGIPQVEIPRFAERVKAGLIVLGRKPRSRTARLIMGDTTDAVVRRSRIPCLLVPVGLEATGRMLVALDGTDRGLAVLRAAGEFARTAGLDLNVVTVDPTWPGDAPLVSSRSEDLSVTVEKFLSQATETSERRAVTTAPLHIRHGDVVEEIIALARELTAEVLVTGFHPGGPLLVVNEGSVSRRLVHHAACAVLTVPL